ncbi:MAG: hypothetical protein K8S62_13985 [Candidatus Sabulitectum sp.]|nr:hypothetical protein [Candidatus Sabulitectum sp.]
MWKKEITDTLKQAGLVFSFLLLIPAVYWINSMRLTDNQHFSHYAEAGITLSVLMLVFSLAYMMFSSEDSDNASEYLKSLPFSKWKLLAVKILPRLAVAWIFIFGYCCFVWFPPAQISSNNALFRAGYILDELLIVSVIPLLVMLSGFLTGISDRKNPVLLIAFLLLTLYPLLPGPVLAINLFNKALMHQGNQTVILISIIATILLPSIVSVFVLIPLYKSWDCASGKMRSQIMLKRMAIPTALVTALWGLAFTQM